MAANVHQIQKNISIKKKRSFKYLEALILIFNRRFTEAVVATPKTIDVNIELE